MPFSLNAMYILLLPLESRSGKLFPVFAVLWDFCPAEIPDRLPTFLPQVDRESQVAAQVSCWKEPPLALVDQGLEGKTSSDLQVVAFFSITACLNGSEWSCANMIFP